MSGNKSHSNYTERQASSQQVTTLTAKWHLNVWLKGVKTSRHQKSRTTVELASTGWICLSWFLLEGSFRKHWYKEIVALNITFGEMRMKYVSPPGGFTHWWTLDLSWSSFVWTTFFFTTQLLFTVTSHPSALLRPASARSNKEQHTCLLKSWAVT